MPEQNIHICSDKGNSAQTKDPPEVHHCPPLGFLRSNQPFSVNHFDTNNKHNLDMTFESAISISVEKDSTIDIDQVETPDTPRFFSIVLIHDDAVPSNESQMIHKKNKKGRIYINLPLDTACLINFLVTGIIAYGYYSYMKIYYRWIARLHTMICIVVMTGHAILYTGCWLYFELAYLVYYIFGMYYHHKLHLLLFLGHLGVPSICGLLLLVNGTENYNKKSDNNPEWHILKSFGVHLICSGCFYCMNFVYQRLKIPDHIRHQILYQEN